MFVLLLIMNLQLNELHNLLRYYNYCMFCEKYVWCVAWPLDQCECGCFNLNIYSFVYFRIYNLNMACVSFLIFKHFWDM